MCQFHTIIGAKGGVEVALEGGAKAFIRRADLARDRADQRPERAIRLIGFGRLAGRHPRRRAEEGDRQEGKKEDDAEEDEE